MTHTPEFFDMSDAFEYCREGNAPVVVRIIPEDTDIREYKIYPSGKADFIRRIPNELTQLREALEANQYFINTYLIDFPEKMLPDLEELQEINKQALAAAKPETGSIEDVKVHDRALTEIELADLMTEEGKQSQTVDLGASRVAAIYKVPPLDEGYIKAGFDCPECNEHVEMLVFHSVAGIEHETCSCSLWLRFLAIDSDKQEKVIIIRQSIGVE